MFALFFLIPIASERPHPPRCTASKQATTTLPAVWLSDAKIPEDVFCFPDLIWRVKTFQAGKATYNLYNLFRVPLPPCFVYRQSQPRPCQTTFFFFGGMQSQLNDVKRYFGADIQRMLQEFEVLKGPTLVVMMMSLFFLIKGFYSLSSCNIKILQFM